DGVGRDLNWALRRNGSRGSFRTRTIPADSTAASLPAPIAMPTSAAARAGPILTPSPTIATFWRPVRNRSTAAALSAGRTWAATSVIPSRRGTASATACENVALTLGTTLLYCPEAARAPPQLPFGIDPERALPGRTGTAAARPPDLRAIFLSTLSG